MLLLVSSVVAVSFAGASPHAIMDPKTKLHAAYKIVIHVWNVASAMIAFAICSFYLIIRYVSFHPQPICVCSAIADNAYAFMELVCASV